MPEKNEINLQSLERKEMLIIYSAKLSFKAEGEVKLFSVI